MKYDLREQLVGLERRNGAAKEAAQGFADALAAGQLDPKGPDFNQGQGTSTEAAAEYAPPASLSSVLACQNGVQLETRQAPCMCRTDWQHYMFAAITIWMSHFVKKSADSLYVGMAIVSCCHAHCRQCLTSHR